MKVCAVIPAAGTGSRLGSPLPKLLLSVTKKESVWSLMRAKLLALVEHIHIIASPSGAAAIQEVVKKDMSASLVSMSIQPKPIGMGDAVFRGHQRWSQADTILVIWGDQVFVSQKTLEKSLQAHAGHANTLALPLTRALAPYVEYILDDNNRLTHIKQSREGDVCAANGRADVGTFILSSAGLKPAWEVFLKSAVPGAQTGEINFLPFLPFLSANGWQVLPVEVADATEARGINTPADLNYFQNLFNAEKLT